MSRLVLFLLIGTLVWAYLSAVLDDISLVISWERWEGTIEHTLMAPVERWLHLSGMVLFGIMHAIVRTLIIFAIALPFFSVDLGQADWFAAAVVLLVGSFSVAGLAILAGILPMLYPERGQQMSMMIQAFVLLVSGVYYEVDVLPAMAARLLVHLARDVHPRRHPRRDHRRREPDRRVGSSSRRWSAFGIVLIPGGTGDVRGCGALGEEDGPAEAAGVMGAAIASMLRIARGYPAPPEPLDRALQALAQAHLRAPAGRGGELLGRGVRRRHVAGALAEVFDRRRGTPRMSVISLMMSIIFEPVSEPTLK